MDLQKLNVKVFVEPPDTVPLTEFIDIFHGWIQATDGDYHDVADYSHMQAGPGIVLIANDANVSIDETENRRGLLFSQKSRLEGSNQEKLRKVFRSALANCRKLEEEPSLRRKLRFGMNEVLISINDRGIAANSDEALEEFKADIGAVARELFGDFEVRYERNRDPRQRLNVCLKASDPSNLRQALAQSQRH
ncbi:MAG TPA: hypothetical protein VFS68_10715 [Candidatus Udaeobacter sp.]|nr:hypothetical protein [Candidatus Udaeobacter sp.]